jgi:hypothetical protein
LQRIRNKSLYQRQEEDKKNYSNNNNKNIVNQTRKINIEKILLMRKNIETIKRYLKLLIFRVKTKNNKKILKKNNF